ncbi:MAG: intracellular protease, PfpI family [Armatimonadetes bacterium]|jgi:protease I|nr:intracellular protease, PfpI family [Armatimonadota bacterium]
MAASDKRVLIFAENDYEDLELWYPKLRLIEAGVQVTVAGPREKVYQSKHGYPVETDGNVADFNAADFDGVVVPGGWCPDRLRRYDEVLTFTREIADAGKMMAAVCHGGWVLVSADVLRGRRCTSVPAIKDDHKNAGAEWVNEPVVVDRNLVTAQVPKDLPAFCREILAVLEQQ